MLFEAISKIIGMLKIILFKLIYFQRISFKTIPKMNKTFKIAIKKNGKIIIGKNMRTRNNVSLRVYNGGILNIGNSFFANDGCSINCQQKITIGEDVIFGQNVMLFDHDHDYKNDMNNFVREDIVIGNNVWIGANVIILKGVTIGDNVVIGAGTIVKKDVPANTVIYSKKENIIKENRGE